MDASISKTITITIMALVLSVSNVPLSKTAKSTFCGDGSGHESGLKSYQMLCSGKTTTRKAFGYQIVKPYLGFAKIENNRVEEIQV